VANSKTKNSPRTSLNDYFRLLKQAKPTIFTDFGLFVLSMILVPVIGVIMPKFFISSIMEQDFPRFTAYFLFFLILSCFGGAAMAYYQTNNEDLASFLSFKLVEKLQRLAMTIPFKETENPETLNQLHAARSSAQSETGKIYRTAAYLLSHGITLAVYTILILIIQPVLLLYLVFNVAANLFFSQKAKDFEFSQRDEKAGLNRKKDYIFQLMFQYQYGKEIRSYNASGWLLSIFDYYKSLCRDLNSRIQKRNLLASAVEVLLTLIREGLAYGVLIAGFYAGKISLDKFVMMFGVVASFAAVAQNFVADVSGLRASLLHFEKYQEFLEKWETPVQPGIPSRQNSFPTFQTIEFRDVSFSYPGSERDILSHFSYRIEAGKHIAVVGPNGAGKTTLVKLLCRLYEDYRGEILADGIEIRSYDRESYWKQISAVFQDFQILAAGVGENVGLSEEPDKELVNKALQAAGLLEKVESLPQKSDTQMSKRLYETGVELSGGEKQKLAIARAIHHGGQLLILDEPTAALDPLAESEVYERMEEWAKGKTAIFISHRLNSTKFCDEILLVQDGKVLEQGTHQALYAQGGMYTEMFQRQAKYYLDEKEMARQ